MDGMGRGWRDGGDRVQVLTGMRMRVWTYLCRGNRLGAEGGQAIGAALPGLTALQTLDLG